MTVVSVKREGKINFVWLGVFACMLAYIITKDISLPPYVLVLGAIFLGVALVLKGMTNPEIITYVLVAYLPFSRRLNGDFGGAVGVINLTNLLMGFLMIVWFSGKKSNHESLWLQTSLNVPVYLFLLLGFIAVVRGNYYSSANLRIAFIEYKRWMTPVFLFFLALNTIKERESIRNVVITMGIVTAIVGLMAIYDYIELGNASSLEKSRIGGIVDQPNMLAAFFNYYMFLPFGFFLVNLKKPKYWLLLIPFLICFRGIMVTFSRGGYLAFALGLFAIVYFRSKVMFLMLLLAIWIAILNPILLPAGIRYRMSQTVEHKTYVDTSLTEESLESSSKTRVEIWRAGTKMIMDYPFFGVGYGLFGYMLQRYWDGGVRDAHNTYLIIAAEMGIPALIVFLWIVFLVFINTLRLYKTTQDPFSKAVALGFLGGLFGLLMSNMFGSRLDSQAVASYFWILAAAVYRLQWLDQKEAESARAESSPDEDTKRNQKQGRRLSHKLDACWSENTDTDVPGGTN